MNEEECICKIYSQDRKYPGSVYHEDGWRIPDDSCPAEHEGEEKPCLCAEMEGGKLCGYCVGALKEDPANVAKRTTLEGQIGELARQIREHDGDGDVPEEETRDRDWEASYDDLGMSFLDLGQVLIAVCAEIRAHPDDGTGERDPEGLLSGVLQTLESALEKAQLPSLRKYLPKPPTSDTVDRLVPRLSLSTYDHDDTWWRVSRIAVKSHDEALLETLAHLRSQTREIERLETRITRLKCLHSDAFTDWQNTQEQLKEAAKEIARLEGICADAAKPDSK